MEWIVIVVLPVCLIVTLFVGCSIFRHVNYSVALRNIGEKEIWIYPVQYGNFVVLAGVFISNAKKVSLSCQEPIPSSVKIKWENSNKEIVEKTVDVKKNIPSRFRSDRDCIIFNIDDDDEITLSFRIETGRYQWEEIDSQDNKVDFSKGKR